MEKTDILIIGGSAAGIVTALTGKSNYPEKEFLVIRKEEKVMVPCGIPYIFGSLGSSDKNIVPDAVLTNKGIKIEIDEVISIDQNKKVCSTAKGTEINFEKLILATGSTPTIPGWLKGTNLENVFTISKDKMHLDKIFQKIKDCKKIVVIGAGFIGVEMSDELNKLGKEVTLVEILPHILGLIFDEKIAVQAEEVLKTRGVKIKSGEGVKEIIGNKKVTEVLLENGEKIEAEAVILAMGYRPNTELAKKLGLKISERGFIKVDGYMRTENSDIFAVGDCAEKKDFITRKESAVMLASTACAEARIAGMNLYKLRSVKIFEGTIAIFSTAIGETAFGAAGLTESMAKKEGCDVVIGTFDGIDKHPGTLEYTHKQIVKLIVARDSGIILGGEVIGSKSTGELINIIGLAIQNKMTVSSILTAQIGTHPMLTAPPTAYPIIKCAEIVAKKIKSAQK
ncbi:MAG: FAD-dependent oxidoreductase [Candidatus Caldatribacteriota bacterium]|nr:FAD-dependent oxidoreductase [Candidatus Caldatribacteriota bacterium]